MNFQKLGRSPSSITKSDPLCRLPRPANQELRDDGLQPTHAPKEQLQIAGASFYSHILLYSSLRLNKGYRRRAVGRVLTCTTNGVSVTPFVNDSRDMFNLSNGLYHRQLAYDSTPGAFFYSRARRRADGISCHPVVIAPKVRTRSATPSCSPAGPVCCCCLVTCRCSG